MKDLAIAVHEPDETLTHGTPSRPQHEDSNGSGSLVLHKPIQVLKRYPDWCVLVVARGNGPRVVEEWVSSNYSDCFSVQVAGNVVPNQKKPKTDSETANRVDFTPVLANPHNSACAQSLVLVPRHPSFLKRLTHLSVKAHCLVKGRFSPGTTIQISSTVEKKRCETFATCLAVVPSNSAGNISLLEVTSPSDYVNTFVVPRQFQQHFKAVDFPILGGTRDCYAFRGEKCCLSTVGLEFKTTDMDDSDSISFPPVPRLRRLMGKEERFWREKQSARADSTDGLSLPAPYVDGKAEFDGLEFFINQEVMIPRRGSEALIDIVEQHFARQQDVRHPQILDLGTGCGNLLLGTLNRLKSFDPKGLGIDMAEGALQVCNRNIVQLGMQEFARTWKGEFADIHLVDHIPFDAILCNPPYIKKTGGRRHLDASTIAHEPARALFVEQENPNIHYETVLSRLLQSKLMATGALMVFEVCKENAGAIAAMMYGNFDDVEIKRDSKGCIRTVHGILLQYP